MWFSYKPRGGEHDSIGGQWLLVSGRAGEPGRVAVSFSDVGRMYMGPHTHPLGSTMNIASDKDRDVLRQVITSQESSGVRPQRSGLIIPAEGAPYKFTLQLRNTGQPDTPENNYKPEAKK